LAILLRLFSVPALKAFEIISHDRRPTLERT
jgi:hypothetical protein